MNGGNGAMHESPCEDLALVRETVRGQAADLAGQRANLHITQQQIGEMYTGIAEAAEHAKIASREATAARHAAERVDAKVFAPVNEVLAKYSSAPPPDYDTDLQEKTEVQHVSTLARRAREAEREAERLAKIEARSKLHLALVAAVVSIVMTLAGIATTYFTMRAAHPQTHQQGQVK